MTADAKYRTKIVRLRGIIRDIKYVSGFQSVLLSSGNMPEYVLCRIRLEHEENVPIYWKIYRKDVAQNVQKRARCSCGWICGRQERTGNFIQLSYRTHPYVNGS